MLMKKLRHTLIVHVIPVTLMLLVMAVAMVYISQHLSWLIELIVCAGSLVPLSKTHLSESACSYQLNPGVIETPASHRAFPPRTDELRRKTGPFSNHSQNQRSTQCSGVAPAGKIPVI